MKYLVRIPIKISPDVDVLPQGRRWGDDYVQIVIEAEDLTGLQEKLAVDFSNKFKGLE